MAVSTKVSSYAADGVSLSLGGQQIKGFMKGSFVTIETQSDDFSDEAGSDGEVARSATTIRRGTVKVKLLQTSLGNDILTGIRNLALERRGLRGSAQTSAPSSSPTRAAAPSRAGPRRGS